MKFYVGHVQNVINFNYAVPVYHPNKVIDEKEIAASFVTYLTHCMGVSKILAVESTEDPKDDPEKRDRALRKDIERCASNNNFLRGIFVSEDTELFLKEKGLVLDEIV